MNDPRPELPLYTYLMAVGDQLKIGQSHHPGRRRHAFRCDGGWQDRIAGVRNDSPPEVEVLAVVPSDVLSEATAIALFAAFRVEGREWFEDRPEIRQFFEAFRPLFVPGPWCNVATFFWSDDPRIPAKIRRAMSRIPVRESLGKFRPARRP